jgi:hypothetical protein
MKKKDAFRDVLVVNIASTIVIAVGIPILIAGVSLCGNFLPGRTGELILAMGSWVYDKSRFARLAVSASLVWFFLLFIITVYFEALILKWLWNRRKSSPEVGAATLSWWSNSVSHLGIFVAILLMWSDLVFGK